MAVTSVEMNSSTNTQHEPDTRPTICQLILTLDVGGAEILAREFAVRAQGDFRFVFACLDECGTVGRQLEGEGYPVEVLERRPGIDFGCARRVARFCREQRVGVVHAHQCTPFFYAALGRLTSRRVPILLTEHGRGYPDRPSWKRSLVNRLLLRRCDRVVAVGEDVRRALAANEGIPENRVEVVYNGIDLTAYNAEKPLRREVREELGLKDHHLAVMQVARLNHLKDHPTAIRAMADLAQDHPEVRLLLVGEGEERPKLEAIIEELGLQQVVRLVGLRRDVPRVLQAADIFLLTSVTEGIPLTLIEAMATGLPCVSTRVGGTPEVIVPDETGLLAERSNPRSVAKCVRQLIADAGRRCTMGQAGRARAHELFDERSMHATYDTLYREMLGISGMKNRS